MATGPEQQSIIPDLPRDFNAVNKNGQFTANWSLFFNNIVQAMQSNFTPEGNLFPQQDNSNIALLQSISSVGRILYNSTINGFEGNLLNPAYDASNPEVQPNFWWPFAMIATNAGNPNGSVEGIQYITLCWDTIGNVLYICTATGTTTTAVWTAT